MPGTYTCTQPPWAYTNNQKRQENYDMKKKHTGKYRLNGVFSCDSPKNCAVTKEVDRVFLLCSRSHQRHFIGRSSSAHLGEPAVLLDRLWTTDRRNNRELKTLQHVQQ